MSDYEVAIWVFMLAAFLGFELIRRVSPLLHTPLMSLTNAISRYRSGRRDSHHRREGSSDALRAFSGFPPWCFPPSIWSAAI